MPESEYSFGVNFIAQSSDLYDCWWVTQWNTESRFTKAASVPSNAQLASYKVTYRVAQCKKLHIIAEELILPSAIDMVSTMIDDATASKLKTIPLSNNTIARCMSKDTEVQFNDKIQDHRFALQMDEATDSNKDCLLITYVRFIDAADLSRGKVLSRVFELRDEIRIFLEEEGNELANKFNNNIFLMKLAYLSDMFQKLNELNLQMQGTNTHLSQLAYEITSFTRKLEMWEQRVKEGNIDSFEKSFIEVNKLKNTVIPCMTAHISEKIPRPQKIPRPILCYICDLFIYFFFLMKFSF
ncbi:Protein FAM200A [Labeo rohita]|uniref:Protein FAM200A n=1 Tax=Labeo rohita TaxID=84645 RepID=A0ABQ8KZD6_LABRO|nr:Protein FAM200A [Labeo rohita]